MVDLFMDQIMDDVARLHPNMKENDGIFNIDLGLFFDYPNQNIVTLKFGLLTGEDVIKGNFTDDIPRYLYDNTVVNHRYPNHAYLTLSRKEGRKISKTGYPIVGPIDALNQYRMLLINCGIEDKTTTMSFPIQMHLSEDKPIGGIEVIVHDWETKEQANKFGIDFLIHEPTYNAEGENAGYLRHCYYVGQPHFGTLNEQDIILSVLNVDESGVMAFQPVINVAGQPRDQFMW